MKVFFAPFDSLNPYQRKIIDELAQLEVCVDVALTGSDAFFRTENINNADIIHFHWFEPFVKSNSIIKSLTKLISFLIRLYFFKKNKKFVWTVHNLVNHEKKNPLLDKLFLFFFTKMIDVFCVHNKFAKQELLKQYSINSDKIEVIPHGNFSKDYIGHSEDISSFKKDVMGIDPDKRTFTFLGHVKAYKGVLDLIKVFKQNQEINNSQLFICGRAEESSIETIEAEIKGFNNIIFKPGFVEENQVQDYIECSDVMIYPYKNILTSGALILGMSMKRTCIASNVGSMSEFLDKEHIFNDSQELSDLFLKLEKKPLKELELIGQINFERIKNDTWKNMAEQLRNIYNRLTIPEDE